jgi:hypothetical protein
MVDLSLVQDMQWYPPKVSKRVSVHLFYRIVHFALRRVDDRLREVETSDTWRRKCTHPVSFQQQLMSVCEDAMIQMLVA